VKIGAKKCNCKNTIYTHAVDTLIDLYFALARLKILFDFMHIENANVIVNCFTNYKGHKVSVPIVYP